MSRKRPIAVALPVDAGFTEDESDTAVEVSSPPKKPKLRNASKSDVSSVTKKLGIALTIASSRTPSGGTSASSTSQVNPAEGFPDEQALVIPGEFDEEEDQSSKPVRRLSRFIIYDKHSYHPVNTLQLTASLGPYACSGLVEAWSNEHGDDLDDETTEQSLVLLKIDAINYHDMPSKSWVCCERGQMDPHIYLETPHAYYILDTPDKNYTKLYNPFLTAHHLFHLAVLAARLNTSTTKKTFIELLALASKRGHGQLRTALCPTIDQLPPVSRQTARRMSREFKLMAREACSALRRPLNEADLNLIHVDRHFKQYLPVVIKIGREVSPAFEHLSSAGLLRDLAGLPVTSQCPLLVIGVNLCPEEDAEAGNAMPVEGHAVLVPAFDTILTPTIARIAELIYPTVYDILELHSSSYCLAAREVHDYRTHPGNPKHVSLVDYNDGVYRRASLDGVHYRIGDTVLVEKGSEDGKKQRDPRSQNFDMQTKWVAKICYFMEADDGEPLAHVSWYTHGTDTILGEVGSLNGLFETNTCQDITLSTIYCRCNVVLLQPGQDEPDETAASDRVLYSYGLAWDSEACSFAELSLEEHSATKDSICPSCALEVYRKAKHRFDLLDENQPRAGFRHGDVGYHLGDFVHLSDIDHGPYRVGQILDVYVDDGNKGQPLLSVMIFTLADITMLSKERQWASKQLLVRDDADATHVSPAKVEGKCFVLALTAESVIDTHWLTDPAHYYLLTNRTQFWHCDRCSKLHLERTQQFEDIVRNQPLHCMELFMGAGGMSVGLELSWAVETRWAIDLSSSACETFAYNHPNTKVYNTDASTALQCAVSGDVVPHTRQRMPKPGEVHLLAGGPPCQAFSGANRSKVYNDVRNMLPAVMLSYVEYYRPQYCILENVVGY